MAIKPPFVPVTTILGLVKTDISSNFRLTCLFAVKLDPVTVIWSPVIPVVGESVITPPSATVKFADPVLLEASVAVII